MFGKKQNGKDRTASAGSVSRLRKTVTASLALIAVTAAFCLPALIADEDKRPDKTKTSARKDRKSRTKPLPPRTPEALEMAQTVDFGKGKMSFTARNVEMQELFKTLADLGQFSIENVDLIPATKVNISYQEMREQDCLSQLLQQIPEVNYIFQTKKKTKPGTSVIDMVQIYPKDSTGIKPGSGTTYNPLDAMMGGNLYGGNMFGGDAVSPNYIPPAEPPKYIPPDEPPVYIPPAEPPVYIPPGSDPVYIPPSSGGDQGNEDQGSEGYE